MIGHDIWSPTRFARNGDVALAYDRFGTGRGTPLLLMMGLAMSRFWWPDGFCRALADEGFDVVRFDQRDTGESTRFGTSERRVSWTSLFGGGAVPYTAEDVVDDAAAVLDAVGWDRAVALGHSQGGVVAQRFALRYPDRTLGLVTCDAPPSDAVGLGAVRHLRYGMVARRAAARYPRTREGDVASALAVARAMASSAYPVDEAAARARIERGLDCGPRDMRAMGRQLRASWHGPRLREVRTPTLVVHGAEDPLVRTTAARATARAVPGARLLVLDDVGHDLPSVVWPTLARQVRILVPA